MTEYTLEELIDSVELQQEAASGLEQRIRCHNPELFDALAAALSVLHS